MATDIDYELKLEPSQVEFLEGLKKGEFSVVYKVRVHGKICVLKVYHKRARTDADPTWREVDIFLCESTAYKRLKEKGFCERKVVPDFYGTMTQLQPSHWPKLKTFLNDELLPDAILIEYIPYLEELNLSNFTMDRIAKLRQILDDIHKVRIRHGDPYPRNMMVSLEPGNERVLWLDFDRAQTCPEHGPLTERQQKWFTTEHGLVDEFFERLTLDYEEGKLNHSWKFYYVYGSIMNSDGQTASDWPAADASKRRHLSPLQPISAHRRLAASNALCFFLITLAVPITNQPACSQLTLFFRCANILEFFSPAIGPLNNMAAPGFSMTSEVLLVFAAHKGAEFPRSEVDF